MLTRLDHHGGTKTHPLLQVVNNLLDVDLCLLHLVLAGSGCHDLLAARGLQCVQRYLNDTDQMRAACCQDMHVTAF